MDSRRPSPTGQTLEALRGLVRSDGWKLLETNARARIVEHDKTARGCSDPFTHGIRSGSATALEAMLAWPVDEAKRISAELGAKEGETV